ncbi:MAG TPA: Gfo/Idh/MocA family oxidoreductase, partial [Bryobacteraceae bacterium]|nr:Gfo/Idh/MocA family oxidoreductase [Bryobacteraceae bacterium]
MSKPVQVAVIGVGRMGPIHALHVREIEKENGSCVLTAVVDVEIDRARRVAAEFGETIRAFASIGDLLAAGCSDASVVVTPTDNHRSNAAELIEGGQRVLMEKPLTGTLEGDREFSAKLDHEHPDALMLAFQRRFDAPLQYTKELMESGLIGRVFKIYSALEDSNPAPDGYRSGGILPDMSVHNVDEILWLIGQTPRAALTIGSRIYSHRLTTCQEDFDDALLYLWFPGELIAQVQVTRNHVSGYRVETIL